MCLNWKREGRKAHTGLITQNKLLSQEKRLFRKDPEVLPPPPIHLLLLIHENLTQNETTKLHTDTKKYLTVSLRV